jgi:hypothetical protein
MLLTESGLFKVNNSMFVVEDLTNISKDLLLIINLVVGEDYTTSDPDLLTKPMNSPIGYQWLWSEYFSEWQLVEDNIIDIY